MATALVVSLLGACTPLDGRSASVEVGLDPSAADAPVEVPWWVTTTVPGASSTKAPEVTTTTAPSGAAPAPSGAVPPPMAAVAAAPTAPSSSARRTAPGWATSPVTERDRIAARTLEPLSAQGSRDVAAAALQLVRFDWIARLPGWQMRFMDGRKGVRGLTFPDSRRIEVYVRSGDTPEELAHVIAHELGHAVDVTYLDDPQRAVWLSARGLGRGTIWFPGQSGVSDFATGAGDFAESFAWVHGPVGHWSGELGPPPTLVQAGLIAVLSRTV
jgi:hypothetical protein